jgi:hypothetical protein
VDVKRLTHEEVVVALKARKPGADKVLFGVRVRVCSQLGGPRWMIGEGGKWLGLLQAADELMRQAGFTAIQDVMEPVWAERAR